MFDTDGDLVGETLGEFEADRVEVDVLVVDGVAVCVPVLVVLAVGVRLNEMVGVAVLVVDGCGVFDFEGVADLVDVDEAIGELLGVREALATLDTEIDGVALCEATGDEVIEAVGVRLFDGVAEFEFETVGDGVTGAEFDAVGLLLFETVGVGVIVREAVVEPEAEIVGVTVAVFEAVGDGNGVLDGVFDGVFDGVTVNEEVGEIENETVGVGVALKVVDGVGVDGPDGDDDGEFGGDGVRD